MINDGFISELNQKYKFKKLKITIIAILIIGIGTILLFFQDFISSTNNKLKQKTTYNLFVKWIIFGFMINILILISIIIFKKYKKKKGDIGEIGITGPKGENEKDVLFV